MFVLLLIVSERPENIEKERSIMFGECNVPLTFIEPRKTCNTGRFEHS